MWKENLKFQCSAVAVAIGGAKCHGGRTEREGCRVC